MNVLWLVKPFKVYKSGFTLNPIPHQNGNKREATEDVTLKC